jgi:hypothetical protein
MKIKKENIPTRVIGMKSNKFENFKFLFYDKEKKIIRFFFKEDNNVQVVLDSPK